MRSITLNKYNNLLTSGRWSKKDPKYDQILYLVGVAQKLADNSKKSSDKSNTSNRESTKVELSYIRDLEFWKIQNLDWGIKPSMKKNWW